MAEPARIATVQIPEDLRVLLLSKLTEKELARWGVEALVVEAAREHIISRRKAATLLGIADYEEREAFFERHGLTLEYTMEMLEMDFRAIDALESKRSSG